MYNSIHNEPDPDANFIQDIPSFGTKYYTRADSGSAKLVEMTNFFFNY